MIRDLPRLCLGLGWLVLALGLIIDARRPSPEPTLRTYLADLEAHRTEAASTALSPEAAARWADFVEFQQFNRYEIVSIAVRSPSLVASLLERRPWLPTEATLIADIAEPSGIRWRGSTVVPFESVGGDWTLLRAPFAPE